MSPLIWILPADERAFFQETRGKAFEELTAAFRASRGVRERVTREVPTGAMTSTA